jgi:hypothetical protein
MADLTDPSKTAKRRSLLMPRGTLANASVSRIASPTKQRPMSMIGLDAVAVRELSNIQTPGEGGYGTRPRADTGSTSTSSGSNGVSGLRKPMSRVVEEPTKPISGTARASSLRKPMVGKAGHARQQSVTKHMPTVQEGASRTPVGRNGITRGPVEDTTTGGSVTRSKAALGGPARTGSTRLGHTRTGSSIASMQSISGGLQLPGPSRPTSMLLPPGSRPAFSTLQQHYSPLKSRGPKPASSSLIHPATIETPSGVTLETSFLQTHLLQLSILHTSFHPTYAEWCASTRHTMRRKFAEVAARLEITQDREREVRGRSNAAALGIWGGGPDGSLGENVQTLATVLQDLDILCDEKGGKVAATVAGFTGWFEAVRELWSLRAQVEEGGDGEAAMEFVDGLGAAWRHEVASLIRRLGGLRSLMDSLEKPQADSTVAEVVDCVGEILRGAIEELDIMTKIEKIVGEQEKAWVDARLDRVIAELDLGSLVDSGITAVVYDAQS